MKSILKNAVILLALAALGAFLVVSNPDPDQFEEYVQSRVEERFEEEGGVNRLGRLLTNMGSNIVGSLAARVSERSNYLLFSLYRVDVGGDGDPDEVWRFLAIGGRFFELSSPEG